MAKITLYLRIAKTNKGYRAAAGTKPVYEPLYKIGYHNSKEFVPTAAFAATFDVPDALFKQAEQVVAEINVALKKAKVAGEVIIPGEEND